MSSKRQTSFVKSDWTHIMESFLQDIGGISDNCNIEHVNDSNGQ